MRSMFCLLVVGWLLASPCRADIKVVVAQRDLPAAFDVAKATPDEQGDVGKFSVSRLDPKLAEKLKEFNPRELAEKADVDLVVTFSATSTDSLKGASGVSVWDRRGLLMAEEDLAAEPLETSMRQAVRAAGLKVTRDRAKLISLRVISAEGAQLEFVQLALERAFVQSPLIAVDFQRATPIQPQPEVQKTIRVSAVEKGDGPPSAEIVILDAKQNSIATFVLPREMLTSDRILKLADEVAEKVGAAAFMTPEKQKTAARRLRAAGQDALVKRSLQASFTPLMASILLNDRDLEAVRFLLHSMAQTVNDDLFRARDTQLHQSMAESLFEIRKFAAQQMPPDYERLVAFDGNGKTTPDQFFHFYSHLKSIIDRGKRRWPPETMQRMEQTYVDGTYELFSKWKTVASIDTRKFAEFTDYTANNLRALMSYANGGPRPSLCDEMGTRITADWLNEFEKLPAAEQNWLLPKRGLVSATVQMPTVCAPKFQPLWTRMEKSSHPFVQVLGLRGPLMMGWSEAELTPEEKGKRLATYYAQTLPILDAELKAGRRNNVHELIENYSLIANNTTQLANVCEPIMTAHMNLADELLKRNVIHYVALVAMTRCHDEPSALRAVELIRKFPRFDQNQYIRDHLQAIEKRFPGVPRLLKDTEPPLMEVVLDVRDLGENDHISHIAVREGVAYGLHLPTPGTNAARVLQVDLKTKSITTVSDLPALDLVARPFNGRPHTHASGCLGTNSYFVSSPSSGVLRVPLSGDPPSTLITSEQLKELCAISLSQAGDRLFAGTNDGRLLSANLKSGELSTLVNGQREIAVTPVDQLGQHRIPALVADEKGEQLWFITETGSFQARNLILWHYHIAKNEFQKLANLGRPQSQVTAHRSGSELVVSDCWLLRWDMKKNEKLSLIATYPCGDLQPDTQQWLGPVGTSVEVGNSLWWIIGQTLNQLPKNQKNVHRHDLPQRMPRPNANQPASLIHINQEEFLIDINQQWIRVRPKANGEGK